MLLKYRESLIVPTDYHAQVQGEMWVCQRKWNDLLFYHPDLPSFVIRAEPVLGFHVRLNSLVAKCCKIRDEAYEEVRRI